MKKEERIKRYGIEAYRKYLEQRRAYYKAHRGEEKARVKKWQEEHPEEVKAKRLAHYKEHKEEEKAAVKKYQEAHPEQKKANHQEQSRKGGKHYDKMLEAQRTGLQGERHRIRINHAKQYRPYKQIIAPDSQLHHEWIPKTAEYRGVALVEKDPHQYGIIDVIEILDGKITLLTEEEVKRGKKNGKESLQAG